MSASEQERHYQTLAVSVVALIVAIIVGVVGYCALQEQHDTAVRSLRAYLGVRTASFAPWKPNEMLVRYNIENFGQTPAYRVRQHLHFDFLLKPPTRSDHPKWTPGTGHAYMSKGVLPNKFKSRRFTDPEIKEFRSKTGRRLYLAGQIFYEDAYGNTRCLDFCVMYEGGDAGTDFVYCPTFNDADYGECVEPGSIK